jgi:uncharacterized protein YdeI (YjbR/CyaY-like superfamily)
MVHFVDPTSKPRAFPSPSALREWFDGNHLEAQELWIRFYKLDSGKPSVTYPEALDEALCVGWIDGIRKRLDDESYIMRFTPRKKSSYWSTVNIRKARALVATGRMRPAGLAAFRMRDASAERRYSFENRPRDLPADALASLRQHKEAWAFWSEQPASYRRAVAWWIVSAKGSDTRERRIALLIDRSRKDERIPQFVSPSRRTR